MHLLPSVSGSGVDPELRVDIFKELDLETLTAGVSVVQGFHNDSSAFLFGEKGETSGFWVCIVVFMVQGNQRNGAAIKEII
ncbi:hypothetical protein DNTS_002823 [Danionella cerebrum]|uniref:Uncharacterized protein n=1 Tax=Danionella cerebrum TaxID=2873325 RepID=A0A553NMC2_9TELE|nr:hypothetical protein DNTS_002823 [Danionella translucida]